MAVTKRWMRGAALVLGGVLLIAGCSERSGDAESSASQSGRAESRGTIIGAGASFPYPVYSKWASQYQEEAGVRLNYQSIGSGGGIAQIKAKTVQFGASDAPLEPAELEEAGLIQFPMVMGGVVPVVNIEGVEPGELKLTPELLAGIFLGRITNWNDPRVGEVNPALDLPDESITLVHRADGSGTTWIFTNYLMKVSPEWEEKLGFGKMIDWPTGIGGKGNEGVANYVQRADGGIGYVEFAYALQNDLSHVRLMNRAGAFVEPTIETFQAAAAGAEWEETEGFYLVLTDQPGETSWPITGASFILMHEKQEDAEQAREVLRFFDWAYQHGGASAEELDYVPMPEKVVNLVQKQWAEELTANGEPVWEGGP